MSRLVAVATCGAIVSVWCVLTIMGAHLPNPPLMQSYNLALGWKGKCLLCRHAVRYLACMAVVVRHES
jgi:hypothetical protein